MNFSRLENKLSKAFTKVEDIISGLANEPHRLFLIDSVGALLSSFFLFVVMRSFIDLVGVPDNIIIYFSAMAACLWLYSTLCYYLVKKNHAWFIMIMSVANLLYCMVTLVILILCCPQVTTIGKVYFTLEIIIVCTLSLVEVSVAAICNNEKTKRD